MKQTGFYASYLEALARGEINLLADTLKCMLMAPSYRPDFEAHAARKDVLRWEASGAGYEEGGLPLAGKTLRRQGGRVWLDADDLSWPSCRIEAVGVVVYQSKTGPQSGHTLVCWVGFGGTVSSQGGPFLVEWPGRGVLSPGAYG